MLKSMINPSDVSGSRFFGNLSGKKILLISWILIICSGFLAAQNNCLDFDGVNDYVDCGNHASLNPTTAITVEAWVNRAGASESKTLETILIKGNYHLDLFSQKPRLYPW